MTALLWLDHERKSSFLLIIGFLSPVRPGMPSFDEQFLTTAVALINARIIDSSYVLPSLLSARALSGQGKDTSPV